MSPYLISAMSGFALLLLVEIVSELRKIRKQMEKTNA